MWAMKFMEVTEEAGDGIQNRQIKKKKVNKTNIKNPTTNPLNRMGRGKKRKIDT